MGNKKQKKSIKLLFRIIDDIFQSIGVNRRRIDRHEERLAKLEHEVLGYD